jgi:hypothetical protein
MIDHQRPDVVLLSTKDRRILHCNHSDKNMSEKQLIGRYEIVSEPGRGGLGAVSKSLKIHHAWSLRVVGKTSPDSSPVGPAQLETVEDKYER